MLLNWNTHYIMANLTEIKAALGLEVLSLNTPKNDDGTVRIDSKTNAPTLWMRHWDNNRRIAVSIHKDTIALIQAGGAGATNLVLQDPEERIAEASQTTYLAYRIVSVTPAEITL